MRINIKYLHFILFAFICSQNEPVRLSLDTFGQSEYYLNELNPFYQSSLRLGSVYISPVDGVPQGSSDINFDFISLVDSNAVTSQFNYSRGSDLFRETKILVNNFISEDKKLLFKAHGRKYPGIGLRSSFDNYESFGEGYILQNYLIDYASYNDTCSLSVTRYHHKENTEIPVDNINKKRLVQTDGLGISFNLDSYSDFFKSKYILGLNYYNNSYYVEHIGQAYDNYEYGFGIDCLLQINKSTYSFLDFNYKEIGRQSEDMFILNYGKYGFLYTSLNNKFEIGVDWVSARLNILDDKSSLFFDFNWNLSNAWSLSVKRDRIFSDLTFSELSISNRYNLLSSKFKLAKDAFLSIDYCNIENVSFNGRAQDNSLIKLNMKFGSPKLLNSNHRKNSLLDMLAMSFGYREYIGYSPIKFNLNYRLHFQYLDMYERKKYLPYFSFQAQIFRFNQGYGPSLSDNPFSYLENSTSSFDYVVSKLEFGISFDTFVISYHILNPGQTATYNENGLMTMDDQYYFPDDLTDIQTPIYQMNYITLQWQFLD